MLLPFAREFFDTCGRANTGRQKVKLEFCSTGSGNSPQSVRTSACCKSPKHFHSGQLCFQVAALKQIPERWKDTVQQSWVQDLLVRLLAEKGLTQHIVIRTFVTSMVRSSIYPTLAQLEMAASSGAAN